MRVVLIAKNISKHHSRFELCGYSELVCTRPFTNPDIVLKFDGVVPPHKQVKIEGEIPDNINFRALIWRAPPELHKRFLVLRFKWGDTNLLKEVGYV